MAPYRIYKMYGFIAACVLGPVLGYGFLRSKSGWSLLAASIKCTTSN
jgi:hypothetical protein